MVLLSLIIVYGCILSVLGATEGGGRRLRCNLAEKKKKKKKKNGNFCLGGGGLVGVCDRAQPPQVEFIAILLQNDLQ